MEANLRTSLELSSEQKKSSIHLLEKEQPKKLDKGSRKEDYGGLSYAHARTATGIMVPKSGSF